MDVAPAFIDETGVLRGSLTRNPVYGIGLLVINDPGALTDILYQLHFSFRAGRSEQRRQLRRSLLRENRSPSPAELDRLFWSTRHHEYKFAEVNGHNLQEYVDLLNLFFSFGDAEFHALLLDRTRPGFNLEPWNFDEWAAYVALTCELIERSLMADSGEAELDSFRQERNRAGSWGGHPATIGGLSEDNQSVTVHSPIA